MPRKLTSDQARQMASDRTHRRGGRPRTDPAHGTHARYRQRCRCDVCRAFMAAYERGRAKRSA